MCPQYYKRQKTNPSLFPALKFPCTLHTYMCSICTCLLGRRQPIDSYLNDNVWAPSTLLLLLLLLFHSMPWGNKSLIFFFFYSSFAATDPCPMAPFLTLTHLPERKLRATRWCVQSFLNALLSHEHYGLYFLTNPPTVVDYQPDHFGQSREFHIAVFFAEFNTCLCLNKYVFIDDYEHTYSIPNLKL